MKKIKQLAKGYFNQCAKTYMWLPSGMLPYQPNED